MNTKQNQSEHDPQLRLRLIDAPPIGESREARLRRVLGATQLVCTAAEWHSRTFNDRNARAAERLARETDRRLETQ